MSVEYIVKELNQVINGLDLIDYLKSIYTIKKLNLKATSNLDVDGNVITLELVLNKNTDTPKLRELLRKELINSYKLSGIITTINWVDTEYSIEHKFICDIVC